MILHLAYFPLGALALMVAVPGPTAVTLPVEETVATRVLLLVQVKQLLSALEGDTEALSVVLLPMVKVLREELNRTLVTLTPGATFTV